MADALASPFVRHGARESVLTGAARLERQVIALETAASSNPGIAFDLAKAGNPPFQLANSRREY